MAKRNKISQEQKKELEQARIQNKNKKVDKRLEALIMRAEGKSCDEVSKKTDFAKINKVAWEEMENFTKDNVRLMFEDEAGFGRINKPKYCWCFPGLRPTVPCHHIREYRYVYGSVKPLTGESTFLILPYSNTVCMNVFLKHLSATYPNDKIILACDNTSWHKAKNLEIPHNIRLVYLPPATPEMNPIEYIWKEIRKRGFRNEIFQTLEKVVDRLCLVINSLHSDTIKSITNRDWIINSFNQ